MKIVLTGGGSGGHFYPLIAVAQSIHDIVREEKLLEPKLMLMAPDPYDKRALFENEIMFFKITAGKRRKYASILNIFDVFKTILGVLGALWGVYRIYPDVIFAKGGYGSFPVLVAARILNIPVIIHESDSRPGRVNKWAGSFAERIAISYPDAAEFFPKERVAFTGNPIRREIAQAAKTGAHEFLNLEENVPVILILGGSQGAQIINDAILSALPTLIKDYQIIHQVGEKNAEEVEQRVASALKGNDYIGRYKPFGFLTNVALKMAGGAADIIISRAGSTIFEIAAWGKPSIIIPITDSNDDHQRQNAFEYARAGAARVIEEKNLTDDILRFQISELLNDPAGMEAMSNAAKAFAPTDAADKIAREILKLALRHEA